MTPPHAMADTIVSSPQSAIANSSFKQNITITSTGKLSGFSTGIANFNAGSIGTLSNDGTILGNRWALSNLTSVDTISNNATGTFNGTTYGIFTGGLSGNAYHATIGALNNAGTINGNSYGIYNGSTGSGTNSGVIGSLSNSGTISGATGIYNARISTISVLTNNAGGMIAGTTTGIRNLGTITSLNNNGGSITGGTGIANNNTGTIASLTNSGVISAGSAGILNNGSIGSIGNGGHINALYAINNGSGGTINTLSNNAGGTLYGATAGILNNGIMGTITNTGTGTISGGTAGVQNEAATISLLSNAGTITSTGVGVSNKYSTSIAGIGTISVLSNSGMISGAIGVSSNIGTIGTIANSGVIKGSTYAIDIAGGASLGGIANNGTIAGIIRDLGTTPLTISGGSNATFGTLTGYNGAIGTIVASSGLVFNGGNQLLNDNITVNSGNGTVTNASGVLQVNNQLTVNGNYYQNAAATLAIGISANAGSLGAITDTGYGRLLINGNATIESGSGVMLKKLTTYSYAAGQRFVVIQASGNSNNYNASSLNYSVAGYLASGADVTETINGVGYHNLVVTITGIDSGIPTGGSPTNSNAATNSNARAALHGLFNYAGVNQGLLDVYNPALAISNPDQANRAGAQLSPAATANAVVGASTAAFSAVQGAAGNRIDGLRTAQAGASGIATGETSLDPALWGRIFGGQANQGTRDGIAGYHANYGGFLLGGDVQAHPDWRIGGLFSYAHSNIGNDGDNSGSGAQVDSYGLTAYAGYDGRPWYVNLTAGVTRQIVSTNRAIAFSGFNGTANGSFNGQLFSATAEAGYPLAFGNATLTPLTGIRYSRLKQDAYTETGGSGAALTVNGSSYSSLKGEIGAKYEYSLMTSYGALTPFVRLGWNHEFRNTALTTSAAFAADASGSTTFTTHGASPLRNTAALSLGATLLRSRNLTLSAGYTLEGTKGYTAQTGSLTLRWQY
ncbi:autotransporter outer membrane beta-barrel domain-containing protein [Herbaspirillum chlorophenolicum]|uniref:autotransporter outer membrane beta-barrel domain-containing protein n=1 Tax=Herbaspirillum chlorophenolicum TaxID=211589 RepID=UPI000AF109CD|nr:autotransporter domain-containing protein [Herbaspirillum chlorophenolicum]